MASKMFSFLEGVATVKCPVARMLVSATAVLQPLLQTIFHKRSFVLVLKRPRTFFSVNPPIFQRSKPHLTIDLAMSLKSQDDIPLADDDLEVIINDDESSKYMCNGRSLDSIASSYTNGNSSPQQFLENESPDADEQEEKARLIAQVLELQNTLDDLSQRVDSVKEENLKLRSENQVLGQYIENLMSASSVFQSTTPNNVQKKK